jgi:hypothetical protein
MPRLVSRIPKYRKHKASGLAVVTLGGHDDYLGPHRTHASKQEYDRLCGEFLAAGRMLPRDNRDELTVVELLDAFWTYAQQYFGPEGSETRNYKTLIARLRRLYPTSPLKWPRWSNFSASPECAPAKSVKCDPVSASSTTRVSSAHCTASRNGLNVTRIAPSRINSWKPVSMRNRLASAKKSANYLPCAKSVFLCIRG